MGLIPEQQGGVLKLRDATEKRKGRRALAPSVFRDALQDVQLLSALRATSMRRRSSSISLASKLEEAEEKRNVSAERRRSTHTLLGTGVLEPEVAHGKGTRSLYAEVFPLFLCDRASRFAESLPDGERFVEARRGGPSHSRGRSAASMLAEKRRGTGRNVPLRFSLSDESYQRTQGQLMVSARSPERGPVSRSRLEMSFSAFPAATCSSLPPAMRKPPALSFQSERKAFAASGRRR